MLTTWGILENICPKMTMEKQVVCRTWSNLEKEGPGKIYSGNACKVQQHIPGKAGETSSKKPKDAEWKAETSTETAGQKRKGKKTKSTKSPPKKKTKTDKSKKKKKQKAKEDPPESIAETKKGKEGSLSHCRKGTWIRARSSTRGLPRNHASHSRAADYIRATGDEPFQLGAINCEGSFALGNDDDDKVDFRMSSQMGCMATKEIVRTRRRRQRNTQQCHCKWVLYLFMMMLSFIFWVIATGS